MEPVARALRQSARLNRATPAAILTALGGEDGCRRLSEQFYARVARDPVLRPLFPGKTLRCAAEEFAAFLIQFLGGDENQTQARWWLSLAESHARFRISPKQRGAWLKQMAAALDSALLDETSRSALRQFFVESSAYVVGKEHAAIEHAELAACWEEQRALDSGIAAILAGNEEEALSIANRFAARPGVLVGLVARMLKAGRPTLVRFVVDAVERDPSLASARHFGKTLLHFASGAGSVDVVAALLRLGADPDVQDHGRHTPLYCVANECASPSGSAVVRLLVSAGAAVNASAGVTRATPLHMAARRGYVETARALLECGAAIDARDTKGATPRQRAVNCRRHEVAELLTRW